MLLVDLNSSSSLYLIKSDKKINSMFSNDLWFFDVALECEASGDATQSFEDVGHSSAATSLMEGYLIGVVEGYNGGSGGAPKAREGGAMRARAMQERGPPSSNFLDYILPLFILAVAFGAWYYLTHYAHDKATY